MLVYSVGKGQRIYHTEQCPYANRIKPENRGMFQTASEAEEQGYYACSYCSKTGKAFRRSRAEIEKFCEETGYICDLRKGRIFVKTPVDSWLIFCSAENGKFQTYHENRWKHGDGFRKTYHRQKWRFISIYDTLLSIFDHTSAYLKKPDIPGQIKRKIYKVGGKPGTMMSRRKKGKLKRKHKAWKKRYNVKCVLDLIDQVSAEEKENTLLPEKGKNEGN